MVLAMSRPTKRQRSSFFQFRKAVPEDLRGLVGKREIKRSLRTRDPSEAKRLHAEMAARVDREWKLLRSQPEPLTNKQIVALSGILYRDLIELVGEEPGSQELWGNVLRLHDEAQGSGKTDEWFGPTADDLLRREGLKADDDSRKRLIKETHRALVQAGGVLKRNAEGDYREDPDAARFPQFSVANDGVSLCALFERWKAETKPSASTLSTWRGVVRNLSEHLGKNASDIRRITPSDIVRWKDVAVQRELAAKTINESYLGCANALFRFAVRNHLLTSNPAEGVKVKAKPKAGTAREPYSDNEVARILDLTAGETHEARRWLPLLAACTGARIGELAQLWGSRVYVRGGINVLKIAPAEDSGSIKNAISEREVPIHPALIEAGFLEFVRSKGNGPLFYGRSSGDPEKKHASKSVGGALAAWIREQGFIDKRKDPSHALRHWFKSVATRVGVSDSTADAIQGHTTPGEASKYRHFEVSTLAEAVAKIPIPSQS